MSFDEWVIDFAGRRLLRADQPVALEPKAFDVLALLARAPGAAFTRDQILDAVWGHRHVTPGVLNRIMTLLRHALGEDAHAARYLRTLHGVGYRFDLPLAPLQGPLAAPDQPAAALVVRPDQLPMPQPPPPPPPPLTQGLADPARRPGQERRRSRPVWPLLGSAGLLVLLLLAAGWWLGRGDVVRPPEAAAIKPAAVPTLIVMPLKPIGSDATTPEIAAGLSEQLISELARIAGLRVIARESTSLAAAGNRSIVDLVPRLQITHALEGSLQQSGEAMRVHIRLIDAASGRTLWAQDFDRQAADVLTLQRDIARAVAASLTLKLALAPAPRGGDAEFLRRYFAASSLVGLGSRGMASDRVDRAESEFRELVHQRPDDARAHAGLATVLELRAFQRPALAEGLRQEGAREAEIALALDPGQADAIGVQAAAACRAEQWERCLQRYDQALAIGPSKSVLRFQQAMALASLGYLQRAEQIIRTGSEHDPLNPTWHFGHARVLDTLGQHDAALVEFNRSGNETSPYGRWFNAVWRRDLAQASKLADAMDQGLGAGSYERLLRPGYVAVSAALRDPRKWPQAETAVARTEQESGLMNFTRVLRPGADAAQMLAGLAGARKRSYSTWDLLVWTLDLDYLRRGPAFEHYIADTGILAYWRQHGFPPQCRARGDSAECR